MMSGVIILETKNTFQIVGIDNKLKSLCLVIHYYNISTCIKTIFLFITAIPKEHSIFELELEGHLIQLYGKHFITKPKDRSKKKIKDNLRLEL